MDPAPTNPLVIGIAGGSGSGKSTLISGLSEVLKQKATLIQQDDYVKPEEAVPKVGTIFNYDHPDAWDAAKMAEDIVALKAGKPVKVFAKDHTNQGSYGEADARRWVERVPRQYILVEGFLVLWYPEVRKLLDLKFFLDAPFDVHLNRRVHFMFDEYREHVLKPMTEQFVTPSKQYADEVIDVSSCTPENVLKQVLESFSRLRR